MTEENTKMYEVDGKMLTAEEVLEWECFKVEREKYKEMRRLRKISLERRELRTLLKSSFEEHIEECLLKNEYNTSFNWSGGVIIEHNYLAAFHGKFAELQIKLDEKDSDVNRLKRENDLLRAKLYNISMILEGEK